jgi:hypothetical protein
MTLITMNTQDREQLNQFLNQLIAVRLSDKNTEAENMVREAVDKQPDAAYLLVQKSLLLEQALNAAKAKIVDLERQLQTDRTNSAAESFLHNDPWARSSSSSNSVPGAGDYQTHQSTNTGNGFFSRVAPQNASAAASGFLGNVATTAAGVMAGSFLFQGIENLLGHRQSLWNSGQQPLAQPFTEQTVINNYYDDPARLTASDDLDTSYADYSGDDFFDDNGANDSDWI